MPVHEQLERIELIRRLAAERRARTMAHAGHHEESDRISNNLAAHPTLHAFVVIRICRGRNRRIVPPSKHQQLAASIHEWRQVWIDRTE